jgi:hypothetical protein
MKQYKSIVRRAKRDLNSLNLGKLNKVQLAKNSQKIISDSLKKLKDIVLLNGFASSEDEIHFFKHIKPPLIAELIYYSFVLDIEVKRTVHSNDQLNQLIESRIQIIKGAIIENSDFNRYVLANETYHDHIYFTRTESNLTNFGTTFPLWEDPDFTTNKDIILAQIIALRLIQNYLSDGKEEQTLESPLIWSDSKNSLVELIYALYSSSAFNNGTASLTDITAVFEKAFNFEVGEIYRTFHEIRNRKTGRTKFLGQLLLNLENKMDQLDE